MLQRTLQDGHLLIDEPFLEQILAERFQVGEMNLDLSIPFDRFSDPSLLHQFSGKATTNEHE